MAELVRIDPPRRPAPPPAGKRGYLVRGTIAPEFVERNALAPEDAIAFRPRSPREAKAFERMKALGAIRSSGRNWWFDIVAYQTAAEARTRAAVPWAIIGSVVVAIVAMMFYRQVW